MTRAADAAQALDRDARERVILVNEEDEEIGAAGKLEAHREGRLHRAFSIFVLNGRGELLLQRRARGKYHSGGLWTNTCCGHPRPGETTEAAAHRRLREEMGFDCPLRPVFHFVYEAELDDGLREHELDHVFVGRWEADPSPDPEEAEAWRWSGLDEVARDVEERPDEYTVWFRIALPRLLSSGGAP